MNQANAVTGGGCQGGVAAIPVLGTRPNGCKSTLFFNVFFIVFFVLFLGSIWGPFGAQFLIFCVFFVDF